MIVTIRNRYNFAIEIEILRFHMGLWTNKELELHFQFPPIGEDRQKLDNMGFKSAWSTTVYSINPDLLAHFSAT